MGVEALVWHTEKRSIADLKNHKKNPRKISKEQIEKLKDSLQNFNYVETVVINLDNTILAGHMRIKALKLLGRTKEEIEVRVPNRMLTEQEADEYVIRSNKNTGEWDFDILANEWEVADLLNWGFNLDELGMDELDEEDNDEEGEKEEKDAASKPGDTYELGDHKLVCGNSDLLVCDHLVMCYKKYKTMKKEPVSIKLNGENFN